MKKLAVLVALVFLFKGNAQPFYEHFDMAFTLGTSHYSGEIANQSTYNTFRNELRMQLGVQTNYFFSRNFSLGVEGVYGRWHAKDRNHQNLYDRNFEGNSNYMYIGLLFKQRFFGKAGYKLRPYFGGGVGANFHHTVIEGLPDGKHQPTSEQAEKTGVSPGFTGLLGLQYQLDDNIDIGLEAWLSLYGNDKIDNLVYANHEADKIGSIRFTLSYKLVR